MNCWSFATSSRNRKPKLGLQFKHGTTIHRAAFQSDRQKGYNNQVNMFTFPPNGFLDILQCLPQETTYSEFLLVIVAFSRNETFPSEYLNI